MRLFGRWHKGHKRADNPFSIAREYRKPVAKGRRTDANNPRRVIRVVVHPRVYQFKANPPREKRKSRNDVRSYQWQAKPFATNSSIRT